MKRITKTLVTILLIVILSMTSITTHASSEPVSPRLSHMSNGVISFSATNNKGYIDVTYNGYDSFVRAELSVKIEKSYLFFFGTEVGTWSSTCYLIEGDFIHTFALTGSGTYRATFTLLIYGNDGTHDTITDVIESSF